MENYRFNAERLYIELCRVTIKEKKMSFKTSCGAGCRHLCKSNIICIHKKYIPAVFILRYSLSFPLLLTMDFYFRNIFFFFFSWYYKSISLNIFKPSSLCFILLEMHFLQSVTSLGLIFIIKSIFVRTWSSYSLRTRNREQEEWNYKEYRKEKRTYWNRRRLQFGHWSLSLGRKVHEQHSLLISDTLFKLKKKILLQV